MTGVEIFGIGRHICSCVRKSNRDPSLTAESGSNDVSSTQDASNQEGTKQNNTGLGNICNSVKELVSDVFSNSGVVGEALQEESRNLPKTIIPNVVTPSVNTPLVPNLICRIGGKLKTISNTITSMFTAFSPFINLLEKAIPEDGASQPQEDEKITVKELTTALKQTGINIRRDEKLNESMVPETKQALSDFYSKIEKLSQRKDLENLDITQLINEWRRDPNSILLLQMAQRIRNGQCAPFETPAARDRFIRSLESLGNVIEHLENQPQSPQNQQALEQGYNIGNPLVENVDIHQNSGGNYTQEDLNMMENNFTESRRRAQMLLNDPELSSSTSGISSILENYIGYITDLIQELCAEKEAEEERYEREKIKKLCEERKEYRKRIEEYSAEYSKKKTLVDRIYDKLRQKELDLSFYNGLVNCLKRNRVRNISNIESNITRTRTDRFGVECEYNKEREKENFYKEEIIEMTEDSPPSYVCVENSINTRTNSNC
jgi:hypothetical protein